MKACLGVKLSVYVCVCVCVCIIYFYTYNPLNILHIFIDVYRPLWVLSNKYSCSQNILNPPKMCPLKVSPRRCLLTTVFCVCEWHEDFTVAC